MDPSLEQIPPSWISIFSNTYLLGFAFLLAIVIILMMFFVLRSRSFHDWYLLLFTTLAVFNLLMLFPFAQSSRLAPGEHTQQFIDIDRPWLLILTYGFSAFLLTASTTSIEYILLFFKPSWNEKVWVTSLRIFTTVVSLSLPLMDVFVEWKNSEASSHCLDNVCRWFLIRKDASLAILLFLWSFAVSITLISANLEQFFQLCVSLIWSEREKKKEVAGPSESELAYQRQLKIEKERVAEIQRRKSQTTKGEREEETVPLTTPSLSLSNVHPQKSVSPFSERKSVERRKEPSAPPEINLVNLNPSTKPRVQERTEIVPTAPPETSFTSLSPHSKIRPQSFRGARPLLAPASPKRRASEASFHPNDLPVRMGGPPLGGPPPSQRVDRRLSTGVCPYPVQSTPSRCPYPTESSASPCPYPETDPLMPSFPVRPYPYPY